MATYVVAGVTGHVGSVVASDLLAQGEKIRAIVRDPERGSIWRERGTEIASGSISDRGFLSDTLAGAAGFFVLLPPNITADDFYGDQRRTADAIAAAVADSAVPHVVMLSSLGAELAEGTGPIKGLHYLEHALRAAGTKLTAIRPCSFQENIAGFIPSALQTGVYPNFLPSADIPIPMVATRDIGHLAAASLKSPPPASETIALLGPAYSARQLAEKLGAALGRPLQVVDIPAGGHIEAFMQSGLPRSIAEVYAELYAFIGSDPAVTGDRIVTGTTSIEEVLPGLIAHARAGGASSIT